jgi:hypothetical protein
MLAMSLDGYNKRSGGYHGTWFHPMQGGMKLQRGGELQSRVYSNIRALTALNKHIRSLERREMSRKERSDLYGDMIELLEQLYNVVVDPDAPESAKWSVLAGQIPKRGAKETGGRNPLAAAVWRGIETLYKDPKGRINALLLVVRAAKLTGFYKAGGAPVLTFLREMSEALGFPLHLEAGVTGALGELMDVTDDGGIRVRRPGSGVGSREREAALGLVQLARG